MGIVYLFNNVLSPYNTSVLVELLGENILQYNGPNLAVSEIKVILSCC